MLITNGKSKLLTNPKFLNVRNQFKSTKVFIWTRNIQRNLLTKLYYLFGKSVNCKNLIV